MHSVFLSGQLPFCLFPIGFRQIYSQPPVNGSYLNGTSHDEVGFARSEILSWWQKRGAVLIDIPADRFAERSEVTGKLVWDAVADGFVIRGLVDIQTIQPLIKVVTRASSPEEIPRFQHSCMPLLEVPLYEMVYPEDQVDGDFLI